MIYITLGVFDGGSKDPVERKKGLRVDCVDAIFYFSQCSAAFQYKWDGLNDFNKRGVKHILIRSKV